MNIRLLRLLGLLFVLVLETTALSHAASAEVAAESTRPDAGMTDQRVSGFVTRTEFRKAKVGLTRSQVEAIFGARPYCKTFDWDYGDGKSYRGFQYRQRNGRFTSVEFDNINTGGRMRLSSKEFGVERYQCGTEVVHLR